MKKVNNKTILFLGLLFMVLAFGCVVGVFYQIYDDHQRKSEEVEQMKEDLVAVDAKKTVAERKAQELAVKVGQGIQFDQLVSAAEKKYGKEERQRKEGDLWIDRDSGDWLITLGAINGIQEKSRLRVYDAADKQIGVVVADIVLDVVSYVHTLEDRGQYTEDSYRVAVE
jgi:hypothetical protein